jgi:hypothetical protein
MIIAGTVANTVQLLTLNSNWQAKKDSGNVLSKEERNERANWTEDDWLKHNFQEQLEQNREASKDTDIKNKIMYGGTITPEEEKYLEQNDPSVLQKYKQVKAEKKAYEEKLKNCKTKDEVQRLKTQTLGEYVASLKKVENDPYIPLSEKLAKAQETLAKTRSIQKVELKFMKSAEYQNLPTEAEQSEERAEEKSLENERAFAEIDESIKENDVDETEDVESTSETQDEDTENTVKTDADESVTEDDKILQDIENTFKRIQLNVTLEEHSKAKGKTDLDDKDRTNSVLAESEKVSGQNVDYKG